MALAGAALAAEHLPQWEIIDYAKSTKPDVPSGTARARRAPAAGSRAAGGPAPRTGDGSYVTGVLLAVRRARSHVGLVRGLDRLRLGVA